MYRRSFLRQGTAGIVSAGFLPLLQGQGTTSSGEIRLNSNENPLPLSSRTRSAVLGSLTEAGRYPLSKEGPLLEKLSRKHGVTPECIVLGNGSSEVIQMAVQALTRPECRVITAEPTFESVADYASAQGLAVDKVGLLPDSYAHNLIAMRELAESSTAGSFVYVCNPNNPTGTLTSCRDLESWVQEAGNNTSFLIDEAYFDYVTNPTYRSFEESAGSRRNLVVTRTFSKVHGLAGLRIGYGIAHPETAAKLRRFASDININQVALAAAEASLRDDEFVLKSLDVNREGKRILYRCLEELKIGYIPSVANFVMYRVGGELSLHIDRMKSRSIRVGRPFPPLNTLCRVSIGLPREMGILTDTLREFRTMGWI